jgi:hypothetical protein
MEMSFGFINDLAVFASVSIAFLLPSPEYVPREYPRIWSIFQHVLIPVCTVRSVAVESVLQVTVGLGTL